MNVFFSAIGGTAIGPLAQIAKQAGYQVSGSDKQGSLYIDYLKANGISDIHIGQSAEQLEAVHAKQPIDWYVYSSAVAIEQPDGPELQFCQQNGIKMTKRDEFINHIISEKNLKLVAIAGTHGKTTTTAMTVWLFRQLDIPITYSVGAKISFGDMGQYTEGSEYFVLETDEFDRNFLAFKPFMSLITGVTWDHHEIFPTRENYQQAFRDFLSQSDESIVWQDDAEKLGLAHGSSTVLNPQEPKLSMLTQIGLVNRQNAWQVVSAVSNLTGKPVEQLIELINSFPGLSRRFEQIIPNLYSDYAHTEEKIAGCIQTASELSDNVVVVYEPLTNRRQHFIQKAYKNLFKDVKRLYWVPSYLAREAPSQVILSPAELIKNMENKSIASPAKLDNELQNNIRTHLENGDLVVCISGGGGGSLDEWLRKNFRQ